MNQFEYNVEQERKTVISNKGVESIHLSLKLKCPKADFVQSVRLLADYLTDCDLEKVKSISFDLQNLD
jgi:hypothetical protein